MKKKLNNALNDIDQRFIDEAAEADRLDSGAPRALKFTLIPVGAAAAVALCILAVNGLKPGSVDLVQDSASGSSLSADSLSGKLDRLPESIRLYAPTYNSMINNWTASNKQRLLYATDDYAAFTDGVTGVYVFSFSENRITFSADICASVEKCVGKSLSASDVPAFFASSDGRLMIRINYLNSGALNYEINTVSGALELTSGDPGLFELVKLETSIEDTSGLNGAEMYYAPTADGGVILGNGNNDPETVNILKFKNSTDGNGGSGVYYTAFSEDYLSSLEREDNDIAMYSCHGATLEFIPQSKTVSLYSSESYPTLSGAYTINGDEIRMKFSGSETAYRAELSDDGSSISFITTDTELYLRIRPYDVSELEQQINEGNAPEAIFTQTSGINLVENTARKITTASGFDKYLTKMLTDRINSTGDHYDKQKAYELITSGTLPLDPENMADSALMDIGTKGGSHFGMDLSGENSGSTGVNVYAVQSGTVIAVYSGGGDDSIGNYIVIDHGSGLATVYGALGNIAVHEGQTVEKGYVIAHTGISGWGDSSGAHKEHLHFEIRRNGETTNSLSGSTTTLLNQKIIADCNNEVLHILDKNNVNAAYDSTSAEELINSGKFPLECDDIYVSYTAGYDPTYDTTFYGSNFTRSGTNRGESDDVFAFQSGKVIAATDNGGFNSGMGNYVIIDHGSGVATVYAHLSSVNVSVGQKVDRADIIGKTGETCWNKVPVLHFELRKDGNALDILSLSDGTNSPGDKKTEAAAYARKQNAAITELIDEQRINSHYYKAGAEELRQNATLPLETETLQDANDRIGWQKILHYGEELYSEEMNYGEHIPVYAYQSGTVIKSATTGDNDGLGSYVVIDHGYGLVTVYAHLSRVDVEAGQLVTIGSVIGQTGSTGYMRGMHGDTLHFELRENGKILDLFAVENGKHVNYDDNSPVNSARNLVRPLSSEYEISEQMFGYGGYFAHKGIDFSAPAGTEFRSADSGKVIKADWYNGYGNCIMVQADDGLVTLYGHCSEILVTEGQQVNAGDTIGKTGSTGHTTGQALHFEVRPDGSDSDPVNPLFYISDN